MLQRPERQPNFIHRFARKNALLFWQNWPSSYRSLYLGTLILFVLAFGLFAVQAIRGVDAIVQWQSGSELQDVSLALDSFTKGLLSFQVETPSYLILERFDPTGMQVNRPAGYMYAGLLAVSLVLLLSIVTVLPRLWYIGSMAIFITWLAVSKLDLLQVFGLANNTFFIAVLLLTVPLSYYFHAFRPDTSFGYRLLAFATIFALLFLIGGLFSAVRFPALSVLSYGNKVPLALSVLFIIMVSPEIMRGLLQLATQSSSSNSLLHFTLLAAIYLFNLVLRYLYNAGSIDWDLFYVNPFIVLVISIGLGVWGFRQRVPLFASILSDVYASFLYLALAIITLATVGYAFATGNNPLVEMFQDAILYSHMGMGLAFFLYVLINFRLPMQQGLAVHKVIYQPRQFPFAYSWGVGGLVMLALLFRANMWPFYHGIAGYNNGLGDLYFAQGDATLAESYYQKGLKYDYRNHKSNYALATLAINQDNSVSAAEYLRQALLKQPQPYTYAKLSNLYLKEDLLFESLFTLKDGIKAFPESGELYNNLALLYNRTGVLDTTYLYYEKAAQLTDQPEVVKTNQLAFWLKRPNLINLDSLWQATTPAESIPFENNRLLLGNLAGKVDDRALPASYAEDSVLTAERFAYLFNYVLNHKYQVDTTLLFQLRQYQNNGSNFLLSEDLALAEAYLEYYARDRAKALELLNGLQAGSDQRSAFFNRLLGLWYLQNDAPHWAANHFERSVQAGDTTMRINQGIALAEAGLFEQTLPIWQTEKLNPNPEIRLLAGRMETVTRTLLGISADSLDDAGKVMLVHLSKNTPQAQIPATIRDKDYRALAFAALARYYLQQNQVPQAEAAYRSAHQLQANTDAVQELALMLLAAKGQYAELLRALGGTLPTDEARNKKPYWEALSYENTGKMSLAAKSYQQALQRQPLNPQVITSAAAFYQQKQQNGEQAYNILVEAIRLNPYIAPMVHKAYIRQALAMGLLDYAEKGLEELRNVASAADYQAFLPEYEAKKASVEKSLTEWE